MLSSQLTPVEASPFFFTSPLIFSLQRFQSSHQASFNMLIPLRIVVFIFKWCHEWSWNTVAYSHFNQCSNKTYKQSCFMWVTPQHFTGMHFLAQFLEKNQLPMSNFWFMYEKFPFRPQHLSCLFCAVEVMPKKNPQKTLLTTFQSTKVHREPNGKHLWCVRFSAAGSTDTVGSHSEIHHIETLTATVHFENLTFLNYQHYFANLQHRHSIKMNSFLLSRFCANSQLFVIKEKDASKRNGLMCLFFFFF